MKKIFAALFVAITLLVAAPANAAVQTYTGVGEYIMSEFETREIAQKRAKERAIRDAQQKAGVYLKSYSRSTNSDLTDDEIAAITANAIKITDIQYENKQKRVGDEIVVIITATVKAQIDTDSINDYLNRKNAAQVSSAVQTFEGVGKYIMSDVENLKIAQERAKEQAIRNAQQKAGVYLKSYSRSTGSDLTDDEIAAITANIIKIVDVQYKNELVANDIHAILVTATVKAQIDNDEIIKWLKHDSKKSK